MELSEEEKKAINTFKCLLDDFKGLSKLSLWYEIDSEKQNELYNKLYPLLNLIKKQQAKIKELEKGNRSLMESRIKWKSRYYRERAKNKKLLEEK